MSARSRPNCGGGRHLLRLIRGAIEIRRSL
ncbi:hypothetical protein HJA82_15355 [Rhizobium bangladeshense]|nr:hypothetical protein [Rhizobium bangladeshense]MBX5215669.1 hypothetical protein [Rhizobium sp. NLR9a]MBX5222785.1 hypothetical protein [Rhizobium sp. NLR8a]MBX5228256.1 hypothetical protein [Rhizobium sp. NLR9b]MBX5233959.1 hypothetical protein [Rhizobium sp. NLR4a]MBX5240202.1 hypothetical protein [Rhizobium sp. NLR22b]MBX5246367.1 hypothetical protein [Rhizobium sp. NLR3b]MBX5250976.1 hypothetical protein [Rhizobium sp. NLR4b]MBX5257873.1 hypothetical protein [Rhizobium sp. NLR16b]MB